MSDPTLPGTPGTGPVPEPEPEGFRETQVEAEKQRLVDEEKDALDRSKEAKDFYTGTPPEPPPPEARSTSHKSTPKGSDSKS